MPVEAVRRLLHKDINAANGLFVLINAAADDIEIPKRLDQPDVHKLPLCKGELALTNAHKAPYLLRLDTQPEIERWLLEKGLGKGWGVFFTSTADTSTLQAHFRRFFQLRTPDGRSVYFRFYSPRILAEFLLGLAPQRAIAFFGPVERFIVEDNHGGMQAIAKPDAEPDPALDPWQVVTAIVPSLTDGWQRRLFERQAQKYRTLGFDVRADETARTLALTDKAGGKAVLQKTARGVAVTTGKGRRFEYVLAACMNPVEITDPAGHRINLDVSENGNQIYAIRMDEGLKSWIFDYDEANHLEAIFYPDGSRAQFGHGPHGHLRESTDRNGHSTIWERDFEERIIRLTDANGHQTQFAYDDLSAPSAITFADGNTFNFEYSDTGTLEKFLADNTQVADFQVDKQSGSWKVNYADGTRAEFIVRGEKIIRATNGAGTVELAYDPNGHLASETFAGRTVTYHRDGAGHLTGITTPFGQTLHYFRDKENRVCIIQDWDGHTITIQYSLNGALESIVYPNGSRLDQRLTAGGLPAEIRLTASGQAEPIFHKKFRRDLLNRVIRISDGHKLIAYTYDRQGRLVQAESSVPELNESFQIDAKANRLADSRNQYRLNAGDKIVQAGQHPFEYDPVGNLTAGTCPQGGATYNYTALNRLKSVEHAGTRAEYVYDAFGRRVQKKVGAACTRFVWAGSQLLHEIQWQEGGGPNSSILTDYLFFPRTPVLLCMRRNRQTYWAAFGHRYEVQCLTDADGRPAWQAEYDAFGSACIEQGAEIFQPIRLAGQYFDAESGLHYNQARYYHSGLGRYLSMDPLFLQGGGDNFYAYCNGDPINHIDTAGEFIFNPILIGAGLGAAITSGIESWRKQQAGKGLDGFAIAKAALLGGAISAVGGGGGAAVETALASGTLAGMSAAGFLSGTAGSVVEQCAETQMPGRGIDPLAITKQALTDGVIGARVGLETFGAGGFIAERMIKATGALRPGLPAERPATLLAKAKEESRSLPAKVKSAAALKNSRSNDFCVSNPVNPVTGEVVLDQTDFFLPGRLPLSWTRHYSSRNDHESLLGPGWQSPADARLETDVHGLVTFYDGTPRAAVFESLPAKEPVMEPVHGARLEATEDTYRVCLKSGLVYHFERAIAGHCIPVVQISDSDGRYLQFIRQERELVQILGDRGQRLQIDCHQGRIVQIRHHEKPLVRYFYQDDTLTAAMDALGHAKRFSYRNGRLVRHTDKSKLSFYFAYNDAGKCTRVWGDRGLYDYQITYRAYERCTRVTDSRGRVQTLVYDKHNLPVQIIDHDGAATGYVYDDVGRVTKVTDPFGRCTQYDYDAAGNVIQITRPGGNFAAVAYDDHHRPIQVLDPNGKIWAQRFDHKGRLIEKIDPLDGRIRYAYNRLGDLETLCDGEGHRTCFEWDEQGQMIALTDPAGNTTRFQCNHSGDITAIIDPSGGTRRYHYDDKSRLMEVVRPSGVRQTFAWDPEDNLVLHTDENGHQTRFAYGGVNKIIRRINADGTQVTFEYDAEENLTGVTNEKGQTHRFEYDLSGRLTAQTDCYGYTNRYFYDPAGQLSRSIDPLERIITYGYDPAGRLQTKTFESDEHESFDWDANGSLTAFQSPGARVERFFDAANNLTAEISGEFKVQYQYDRNGRRIQRATSHGNRVQYTYDPVGAVNTIQINDHEPVIIRRNALRQIVEEHFSTFLQRSFVYNEEGLLSHQTINSVSGQIQRRYEYDPAGRLVARHDSRKGQWRFSYDPMGRITEALDPKHQVQRFAYDPAGDLLEHLPDTVHGLRSARYNCNLYQYDAAGNLAVRRQGDDLMRFTWDEQHRLRTARKADETRIDMAYDALGRRHRKAVNGERTFFAWDGDALLSERFEDGPAREYVYYPGTLKPLAVIDGDSRVYYYHNDLNGLPQELTRPNGEIVWSATYDALGRADQILVDDLPQPLRLQGQYYDIELGLCYNRYCYFDPHACSIINYNPLGLAAGGHVYAYAPNVWGWVDPLGLAWGQKPKKVYRGRSAIEEMRTPRPQDMEELCAFGHLAGATAPGSKAQVIDPAKLKKLEAIPGAPPERYVDIKAKHKQACRNGFSPGVPARNTVL